jgi:hypothetical protein
MGCQVAGAAGGAVLADAMFGVPVPAIADPARRQPGPAGRRGGHGRAAAADRDPGPDRPVRAGGMARRGVDRRSVLVHLLHLFRKPAVTISWMLTSTYAGIAPASVLAFIAAEILGGGLGVALAVIIYPVRPHQIRAGQPARLAG